MQRIGVVVQARLASTRLPGKALVEIAGQPLLGRLLERLRLVKRADVVLVATSPASGAIIEFCRACAVPCVAGPEEDVLSRHLMAVRRYGLTAVVRVTGDNPLTDPGGVDELIEAHIQGRLPVLHNKHRAGYPFGTGAELVAREVLETCDAEIDGEAARARVFARLFDEGEPRFPVWALPAPAALVRPDYFLTVDHAEDVRLMDRLYGAFEGRNDVPLADLLRYLDAHPELTALNRHLHRGFAR
jgi:spore coat polysaccharide biosynthesis protein SpsF